MSSFDLLDIPPLAQFVTDEEAETLRQKQEYAARKMGEKWLLHPTHSPQRKPA